MLYKEYLCARTLSEALAWLGEKPGTRPIAGGTDLMVQLQARTAQASRLVDISRLPELKEIRLSNGMVHIGAAATYQAIIDSEILREAAPLLVESSRQVGAAQVQHMGTIGGNIANASPAGDLLPPLYALEAWLTLVSSRGERQQPIREFILGVHRTTLRPGEIITAVHFEALKPGESSSFVKFGLRQSQMISVVSVAARLQAVDGIIRSACIGLGAVAPTVVCSLAAENTLIGKPGSPYLFEQAGDAARRDSSPIDDIRGSAAFRRHLVGPLVQRALQSAWEHAYIARTERK